MKMTKQNNETIEKLWAIESKELIEIERAEKRNIFRICLSIIWIDHTLKMSSFFEHKNVYSKPCFPLISDLFCSKKKCDFFFIFPSVRHTYMISPSANERTDVYFSNRPPDLLQIFSQSRTHVQSRFSTSVTPSFLRFTLRRQLFFNLDLFQAAIATKLPIHRISQRSAVSIETVCHFLVTNLVWREFKKNRTP